MAFIPRCLHSSPKEVNSCYIFFIHSIRGNSDFAPGHRFLAVGRYVSCTLLSTNLCLSLYFPRYQPIPLNISLSIFFLFTLRRPVFPLYYSFKRNNAIFSFHRKAKIVQNYVSDHVQLINRGIWNGPVYKRIAFWKCICFMC